MGKFYIHDKSRGHVGNSMVWWRKDHRGYTCDIREAHVFDGDELPNYLRADDLIAYPCEYIDQHVSHHIEGQKIDRSQGVLGK